MIPTIKVAFIGDQSVGKTSFILRHYTGHFYNEAVPQVPSPAKLVFFTSKGKVRFKCYEGYDAALKIDCAFVMFDVTSSESYARVPFWIEKVKNTYGDIPVILLGNKSDLEHPVITDRLGCMFYYTSAKTNFNFDKPFMQAARDLLG